MRLPYIQSESREFSMLQTQWSQMINPVLSLPQNSGVMLKAVELFTGTNIINHRLGRKPQGWMITDINGPATIYRSFPFNDLTLTLNSSANATVNLYVF